MAQKGIDIDYNNIETNRTKLTQIITDLSGFSSTIKSAWGYLNGRVQNKIGSSFDCQKIEEISEKVTQINDFLSEVMDVYKNADLDLSAELTMEYLEVVYPEFATLSDERKAILLSAIKYLGLKGQQVEAYANNFKSQYQKSQFVGNTEQAWCAMFVGSLVNYFYGSGTIIDKSYASVWKIFGDYNNQSGIAYETDPRIQYYMSEAAKEKYLKYLNADGTCGLRNWQSLLNSYNKRNGTNVKISDWYSDEYKPVPGDIIALDMFRAVKGIGSRDTLSDYNTKTDYNKAVYLNNNNGRDFPGATSAYSHVAFVLGTRVVDGVTYVDTIDGNYSNDVRIGSYRIDDPRITGYGHIEYEKFTADQSAVQRELSRGVDVSKSHAKISNASRTLIAFDPNTVKSNYLNTMANNVFGTGTTSADFVRTLQRNNNSSTQDSVVQTATQAKTTETAENATKLINNDTSTQEIKPTETTTQETTRNKDNNNYNYNYSSSSRRSNSTTTTSSPATTVQKQPTIETTSQTVDETTTPEYTEKVIEEIESESASIFKRNNEVLERIYGNQHTVEEVPKPTETTAKTPTEIQTVKPQPTVTESTSSLEPTKDTDTVASEESVPSENLPGQVQEQQPDRVVESINNEPIIENSQLEPTTNIIENINNTGEQVVTSEQPATYEQVPTPAAEPSPAETNNTYQEPVSPEPLNPRETETVQRPNEPVPIQEEKPTSEKPEIVEEEEPVEDDWIDDTIDESFEDDYDDSDIEYRNDEEVYVPDEPDSTIIQTNKPVEKVDNKDHTARNIAIAGAGVAAVAAAGVAISVHNKKKRERG